MTTPFIDMHKLLLDFVTPERISLYVRIILIFVIGFPLVRFARGLTGRLIKEKLSAQSEMLIKRVVYYLGILIIFVSILNELGFKLSALLGAAGVLGIAIGFASQTSFSNIISGIFLISEKPFAVGDIIQIGNTVGYVLSVDLLSIKVRTFDYRFVRIPNENMIKAEIINLTKFENRQVNLNILVSYKDNLNKVLELLRDIAGREPLALKEPEATVQIDSFADSGVSIMFGVWGLTENFIPLKTALLLKVKERFEQEKIEIPFPHITIANIEDKPLPVKLNNQKNGIDV